MEVIPMFTEMEERRLLLGLARGRPGCGWVETPEGLPAREGADAPVLPPLNRHNFQRPAHQLICMPLVALAYEGLEISSRAVAARLP